MMEREGDDTVSRFAQDTLILYDTLVQSIELPPTRGQRHQPQDRAVLHFGRIQIPRRARETGIGTQEDRGRRHPRVPDRSSARGYRIRTCAGAASRRRFSLRNPRIQRSSSSAAPKTACRSFSATWIRRRHRARARRRPLTAARRPRETTAAGPAVPLEKTPAAGLTTPTEKMPAAESSTTPAAGLHRRAPRRQAGRRSRSPALVMADQLARHRGVPGPGGTPDGAEERGAGEREKRGASETIVADTGRAPTAEQQPR